MLFEDHSTTQVLYHSMSTSDSSEPINYCIVGNFYGYKILPNALNEIFMVFIHISPDAAINHIYTCHASLLFTC